MIIETMNVKEIDAYIRSHEISRRIYAKIFNGKRYKDLKKVYFKSLKTNRKLEPEDIIYKTPEKITVDGNEYYIIFCGLTKESLAMNIFLRIWSSVSRRYVYYLVPSGESDVLKLTEHLQERYEERCPNYDKDVHFLVNYLRDNNLMMSFIEENGTYYGPTKTGLTILKDHTVVTYYTNMSQIKAEFKETVERLLTKEKLKEIAQIMTKCPEIDLAKEMSTGKFVDTSED